MYTVPDFDPTGGCDPYFKVRRVGGAGGEKWAESLARISPPLSPRVIPNARERRVIENDAAALSRRSKVLRSEGGAFKDCEQLYNSKKKLGKVRRGLGRPAALYQIRGQTRWLCSTMRPNPRSSTSRTCRTATCRSVSLTGGVKDRQGACYMHREGVSV